MGRVSQRHIQSWLTKEVFMTNVGTVNQIVVTCWTGWQDVSMAGKDIQFTKADYTALDLIANFKHNLWRRKDQPSLPLCDHTVEINQVGSRTLSNPWLWWGLKERGFLFNQRHRRRGNEGKWSHRQPRISFQVTLRRTSTTFIICFILGCCSTRLKVKSTR